MQNVWGAAVKMKDEPELSEEAERDMKLLIEDLEDLFVEKDILSVLYAMSVHLKRMGVVYPDSISQINKELREVISWFKSKEYKEERERWTGETIRMKKE